MPDQDGHLSVHQVLASMGFPRLGQFWKQPLARSGTAWVPHIQKQFDMSDGRKGRRVPAIQSKDWPILLQQVGEMSGQQQTRWVHFYVEKQVVEVLMAAFQDHKPEATLEVNGVMVDVFFHRCQLAVVLMSVTATPSARVLKLEQAGIQVVQARVYHRSFQLGGLIRELRMKMDPSGKN